MIGPGAGRAIGAKIKNQDLSLRDGSLVTIAALAAMGDDDELEPYLRRATENGLPRAQITEALTHLGFYAGWAKATRAICSAHDHQNHHMPSLPQPTKTFSSSARAAGLTTYRLGLRPGGAMSHASSPRWDNSSDSFSR